MKHIPITLIYSRLFIGFLLIYFSWIKIDNYPIIAVVLFSIGLLTDIFDGIIARKLNISTDTLRRLDSTVDQVFFVSVGIATFIECRQFFEDNYIQIFILLGVEALAYLICYIKFKKEVATHAISSKIWTLFLFASIIQVMITCNSGILFQLTFYIGLITRFEIIAIILVLRKWANDVPSIYHAFQLRKGKKIKRHKLFNG